MYVNDASCITFAMFIIAKVIISQIEVICISQNHNIYFWLLPYSYIYYVMLVAETLSQSSDPHRGYHE